VVEMRTLRATCRPGRTKSRQQGYRAQGCSAPEDRFAFCRLAALSREGDCLEVTHYHGYRQCLNVDARASGEVVAASLLRGSTVQNPQRARTFIWKSQTDPRSRTVEPTTAGND